MSCSSEQTLPLQQQGQQGQPLQAQGQLLQMQAPQLQAQGMLPCHHPSLSCRTPRGPSR